MQAVKVKKVKTDEERAAEQLRNLVEDQLQDWANERLPHEQEGDANILAFPLLATEQVKVSRATSRVVEDGDAGVRYQRCGGGRRVIRKTKGGE